MINPSYAGQEKKIRAVLRKEGITILRNIFDAATYRQVQDQASAASLEKDVSPLTHSYSRQERDIPQEVFQFLKSILPKKSYPHSSTLISLTWKDYTILHDNPIDAKEPAGVDIILDLTEGWREEWGGIVTYDDGRTTLKIPPQGNSLTLLRRTKKMQRYIKYVNHHASGKRRRFILARLE